MDHAKPLGGSCYLCKVRCRQPEKILFPPQLPVLLAEAVELLALLCGEQAPIDGASFPSVDAGLPDPAREGAGRDVQSPGDFTARDVLPEAEIHRLRLLYRYAEDGVYGE